MESRSAKRDLAVLVANKVTVSQLHLMAADEMSLILGFMSRSPASPLLLLVLHVGLVVLLSTAGLHTQACCIFTQSSRCCPVHGNFPSVSAGAVAAQVVILLSSSQGVTRRESCAAGCTHSACRFLLHELSLGTELLNKLLNFPFPFWARLS